MELSVIKFVYFLIILQILDKVNAKRLVCEFDRHHDVCSIRDLDINSTTILFYEPTSIRHPIKVIFTRSHIYIFPSKLFGFYPTITSVTMKFASLTDIGESSFIGATQLKVLNLSHNNLTKLSAFCFRGATNIVDLNLSRNRINYLSSHGLIHLENLKHLDLSFNKFVDFNVEALQSYHLSDTLEYIHLNDNKMSSINFTKITLNNIKTINLADNQLTSVVLTYKSLTQVILEYNLLSSIEMYNADGLKSINCLHNNLTNIDFLADLKQLTHLDLSYNSITNFIPVNKLKNLKELSLRNSGFTINDFKLFSGLDNLMHIDLSENMLNSLNLKFISSEDVIKFEIEHNNFTEIMYKEIADKFINLRSIAFCRNSLKSNFNCTYLQEIVDFFVINSIKVVPDNPLLEDKKYMASIGYKDLTSVHGILCLNGTKEPETDIELPIAKEEINEDVEIEENVNQEFFSEECLPIKKTEYFKYSLIWILIVIVVCYFFYKMFVFYDKNEYFQFLVRFRTSARTDTNLLCNDF